MQNWGRGESVHLDTLDLRKLGYEYLVGYPGTVSMDFSMCRQK